MGDEAALGDAGQEFYRSHHLAIPVLIGHGDMTLMLCRCSQCREAGLLVKYGGRRRTGDRLWDSIGGWKANQVAHLEVFEGQV